MKGIGTSSGIGMGKVFIYEDLSMDIRKLDILDISREINRFEEALKLGVKEIENLYDSSLTNIGKEEADIFIAHKMMLEDPEFINSVKEKIQKEQVNAEYAVDELVKFYVSQFESIDDEYLKARAADLKDVSKRLLKILLGIVSGDLRQIEEKSIIVAEDLTPSDTAQMKKDMVVGIVTELGGRTSHTSIIARTLEIPAIAGVKDGRKELVQGQDIIINGDTGDIIVNPSKEDKAKYEKIQKREKEFKKNLGGLKNKDSLSKDGHRVELAGNIGGPDDIDKVLENGGEGVGLYRTEFLYMDRDRLPSEEEQFQAYKTVARKLKGKPLIIRTLDVGGDKELPYLNLPKEMNPFLGYRAIRLCLDRQDIFRSQLRAILRASTFGNIKIMFPMISNLNEVRAAKKILEEVKEELKNENIFFAKEIEIGIMVEIPAVAIHSSAFAKEVDFFSIGTNDLIQYTLAVDRGNQEIVHLYNQFHPAVLNLIKITIDNGHKEGIWVGMCGEVAGDKKMLPLLLAMGLDEFSMGASSILRSRYELQNYSKKELEKHLDYILNLPTAEDVEAYIEKNILN